MAIIFSEQLTSLSSPTEIFEKLRKYSNVNPKAFQDKDSEKMFDVYSENTTYYIHNKSSILGLISNKISAELKLTKLDNGGGTEIFYKIKHRNKVSNNIVFLFILLTILWLILIFYKGLQKEDITPAILIMAAFYYWQKSRKTILEDRKAFLKLFEKIK